MNFNNLTQRLEFMKGGTLYTPPDPYQIYSRLACLFMEANGWTQWIRTNTKVAPYDVFKKYEVRSWSGHLDIQPIHFLKWVHQGIPEAFWKFNVYIDGNIPQLLQSAKHDPKDEIWINMKGKKNKLKSVKIDKHVLTNLRSGIFYAPSYEEIVKEVGTWGNYQYNFGNVKQTVSIWKGV